MTTRARKTRATFALIVALAASTIASGNDSYRTSIAKFRAEREAELRAEDGWLSVSGLFWLKEGENRFGADSSNDIVLPEGSAPPRAGVFELRDGVTTLRVAVGAEVTLEGNPVTTVVMNTGETQKPAVVRLGGLRLQVIKRGERSGIRVKDSNAKHRLQFKGLRWFAVKETYRLTATFVAYDKPRDIEIANVLGDVNKMPSPGYVLFNLAGKQYRLDPILEGDDKLFFIFADLTNNRTTYGAGRFLYAELPRDGKVMLDFNQAINPPCAFTQFATCPLPPRQNRLKIAIEAGELNYVSPWHPQSSGRE